MWRQLGTLISSYRLMLLPYIHWALHFFGWTRPSNPVPSNSVPSNSVPSNSVPSNSVPSENSGTFPPQPNAIGKIKTETKSTIEEKLSEPSEEKFSPGEENFWEPGEGKFSEPSEEKSWAPSEGKSPEPSEGKSPEPSEGKFTEYGEEKFLELDLNNPDVDVSFEGWLHFQDLPVLKSPSCSTLEQKKNRYLQELAELILDGEITGTRPSNPVPSNPVPSNSVPSAEFEEYSENFPDARSTYGPRHIPDFPDVSDDLDALVPYENLLGFGLLLFFLSLVGIFFNKQGNFLIVMLFFELMLYSLSFTSIIFSLLWGYPQGQIFALLIMSVAVAESSIGLGLLITVFRSSQRIDFDEFSYIKA